MCDMAIAGLLVFGLCAGLLTATGYFAVITAIGLINRMAAVTDTRKYLILYEEMIILGAVLGTIVAVFDIRLPIGGITGVCADGSPFLSMLLMDVVVGFVGIISGMYVGLFVVCLAETTKALPVFLRRVRIGAGLGVIILMMGIGKAVGQLIYYLILYR